jgi:hypothetical protein
MNAVKRNTRQTHKTIAPASNRRYLENPAKLPTLQAQARATVKRLYCPELFPG